MYAVSFRIPYNVPYLCNERFFLNKSAICSFPIKSGKTIEVADKSWTNSYGGVEAEVIESQYTNRPGSSFQWEITDLSGFIEKKT